MVEPAYTRLDVDERRRRLLDLGTRLFTERAYDELSMADIAREADISKGLLYHYFPSKQAYFVAVLQARAADVAERVRPDGMRPPVEQLEASLDAFLEWVEVNPDAYAKLVRSGGLAEVRDLVEEVRGATAALILEAIAPEGAAPAVRGAVRAWLWFLDGLIVDWLEHRDAGREEVRRIALGALGGALAAGGAALPGS